MYAGVGAGSFAGGRPSLAKPHFNLGLREVFCLDSCLILSPRCFGNAGTKTFGKIGATSLIKESS